MLSPKNKKRLKLAFWIYIALSMASLMSLFVSDNTLTEITPYLYLLVGLLLFVLIGRFIYHIYRGYAGPSASKKPTAETPHVQINSSQLKESTNNTSKISVRPMTILFLFFGLLIGSAFSKFLTRTFIVYPTFADPQSAGYTAFILTGAVIVSSAWLNSKLGDYIAKRINERISTKIVKASIAWGISIVALLCYLFATGFFFNMSKAAQ